LELIRIPPIRAGADPVLDLRSPELRLGSSAFTRKDRSRHSVRDRLGLDNDLGDK